jgi:hypothetical protein
MKINESSFLGLLCVIYYALNLICYNAGFSETYILDICFEGTYWILKFMRNLKILVSPSSVSLSLRIYWVYVSQLIRYFSVHVLITRTLLNREIFLKNKTFHGIPTI